MKGRIFDIQRFSVHDGPGIRTTVFMKGCPLRCRWCHNPEGLSGEAQLQFFEEQCIGCGSCGSRKRISDAARCPAGALKVCGREMDEEELVAELLKDRAFYAENGGVTFSGGECLLQADFVVSVLERIKASGFTTAIDTCGLVPSEALQKTFSVCDLYLYDVKCIDPRLHQEYTGGDNALILENLRLLSAAGKRIWVRVPIIPGFNNTKAELTAIAEFIAALPAAAEQVTLIPYHTLGAGKYKTLGMKYPFDGVKNMAESEMADDRRIFTAHGLHVGEK